MKVDATAQVGSGIEAYKGTFEWKINEETLIPPTPGEVASGDTTPIKTLADFYSKDSKVEFDLKTGSKLEYQDSDFSIPPDIAGGWDCWAVGIAIMKSWKEAGPYSVQETMRSVGDDFYALWNAHEIASSTDMDVIARRLGMETEMEVSYPPSEYLNMLASYGPLFLVADINGAANIYHTYIMTALLMVEVLRVAQYVSQIHLKAGL